MAARKIPDVDPRLQEAAALRLLRSRARSVDDWSDEDWRRAVADFRKLCAAHPRYIEGRSAITDAFRDAAIVMDAVDAAPRAMFVARYGSLGRGDERLFPDAEIAEAWRQSIAVSNWSRILPTTLMPLDPKAAADHYFRVSKGAFQNVETFSVQRLTLQMTADAPAIAGFQIVDAKGDIVHGTGRDPFGLSSYAVLAGAAAARAYAICAEMGDLYLAPVRENEFAGMTLVEDLDESLSPSL